MESLCKYPWFMPALQKLLSLASHHVVLHLDGCLQFNLSGLSQPTFVIYGFVTVLGDNSGMV
jgi:hypothetical protein